MAPILAESGDSGPSLTMPPLTDSAADMSELNTSRDSATTTVCGEDFTMMTADDQDSAVMVDASMDAGFESYMSQQPPITPVSGRQSSWGDMCDSSDDDL